MIWAIAISLDYMLKLVVDSVGEYPVRSGLTQAKSW
jgi:hypothetical protein